jgi:hypothetical protein
MRAKRARYQQGTIRKVPRANGSAWEVRFSETTGGTRKRKTLDFPFNSEYQMKRQSGNAVVRDVELRIGPVLVLKLTVRYVVPCRVDPVHGDIPVIRCWPDVLQEGHEAVVLPLPSLCHMDSVMVARIRVCHSSNHVEVAGVFPRMSPAWMGSAVEWAAGHPPRQEVPPLHGEEPVTFAPATTDCPLRTMGHVLPELLPCDTHVSQVGA